MEKHYYFSDGHYFAVIIMFFTIIILGVKVSEEGFINLTGQSGGTRSIDLRLSYPAVYSFTFLGKSHVCHGAFSLGKLYLGKTQLHYKVGDYFLNIPVKVNITDGKEIELIQKKWHNFWGSKSSLLTLSVIKDKLGEVVIYGQEIMQKLAKQKQKW